MSLRRQHLRQLPPSAVPITAANLRAGTFAGPAAHARFRADIAAYLDIPTASCQLASSGRTVIYALLKGLASKEPERRQVIIPAYTCPVLPKVALDLGLEAVYVDIEPQTMRYQPEALAAAVGRRTLAIFLVHPFGIPLPMSDVWDLAQAAGAVVIEDAAQALGARWAGQLVGLAGDFGLYSLGPGKPLSTAGGGIAVTGRQLNNEDLYHWWAVVPPASAVNSAQAWLRQVAFRLAFQPQSWWAVTRTGLQRLGNEATSWGYVLRDLSPSQAAVGSSLLPHLEAINLRRKHVAKQIIAAVPPSSRLQLLDVAPPAEPIYLRQPLLAASESQRDALFESLWAAGIGVGRMYEKTLPAIFEPGSETNYPGAESFSRRLLTLPTHYQVTDTDIATMRQILARF